MPASPALDDSTPSQSSPGRTGARDSGTSATTATNPMMATGTLSRKTQPHQ